MNIEYLKMLSILGVNIIADRTIKLNKKFFFGKKKKSCSDLSTLMHIIMCNFTKNGYV